jgi:hypothetical protein
MQSVLEIAELGGLLGLTFSLALLLEWALLRAILRAIAAGLRPVAVPAQETSFLLKAGR